MKKTATRRDFLRIAGLAPFGYSLLRRMPRPKHSVRTLYVGTYTDGDSEGIYRCSMNSDTGELAILGTTGGIENPSFLALHPDGGQLYAVSETGEFEGEPGGGVFAFAIDRQSQELRALNARSSHGGAPCYVTVTPEGDHVLVANYSGGNVAALPVRQDGSLDEASSVVHHEGSSVNEQRQKGPHAHCIITDPAGAHALAVDLGTDQVVVYRLENGTLTSAGHASVKPGAGPRHLTFHPDGRRAYVINELDSTVTAFSYEEGTLTETQTLGTLPDDFEGDNYPADIHVSADGRFVYGSNRGHDSIVVFAVDPDDGSLSPIQHQSTGGEWPRNFSLDPSGRFLLVANQRTNNIVILARDSDAGTLTPTGQILDLPSPVCLRFVR